MVSTGKMIVALGVLIIIGMVDMAIQGTQNANDEGE